ncbi:hypothetical protein PG984_016465 [Apiospora sp. TS-2023a]
MCRVHTSTRLVNTGRPPAQRRWLHRRLRYPQRPPLQYHEANAQLIIRVFRPLPDHPTDRRKMPKQHVTSSKVLDVKVAPSKVFLGVFDPTRRVRETFSAGRSFFGAQG